MDPTLTKMFVENGGPFAALLFIVLSALGWLAKRLLDHLITVKWPQERQDRIDREAQERKDRIDREAQERADRQAAIQAEREYRDAWLGVSRAHTEELKKQTSELHEIKLIQTEMRADVDALLLVIAQDNPTLVSLLEARQKGIRPVPGFAGGKL